MVFVCCKIIVWGKTDCYNGKNNGETWRIGSCQRCQCENGKIYCKASCKENIPNPAFLLQDKFNSNVIKVTNDYCKHSGRMVKDKEIWHETGIHASSLDSQHECMQCQCNRGIVTCTIRICPSTDRCRKPIFQEGSCCPVCPETPVKNFALTRSTACSQWGSLFPESSTWKMYIPVKKKLGRCLECSCTKIGDGYKHVCTQLKCPALTCENPIGKLGQCCGTCKGSRSRSRSAFDDDFRKSNMMTIDMLLENGLNTGSGRDTTEFLPPTSINGKSMRKLSNLDCDQFGGKVYRHNERFTPEISKCLRCVCKNSKVQCDKVICPSTFPCRKPELRDGLCCQTCPSISDEQARKIEDQNVARIGKKRSTSCSQNDDRIQVYQFGTGEEPPNALKMYFLFDRSHQYRKNPSEMHFIELKNQKPLINISFISKENLQITGRWQYIGSFKDKILKRIKRQENDLKLLKDIPQIIQKMDVIRKMVIGKAGRRKTCKTKNIQTRETSKILQALQEVDKGK